MTRILLRFRVLNYMRYPDAVRFPGMIRWGSSPAGNCAGRLSGEVWDAYGSVRSTPCQASTSSKSTRVNKAHPA
jgi:hypothetical protein